MDKQILYEEYLSLKTEIHGYSDETTFYVYALCYPNGSPFYIGKGRDTRAFDHLKSFITGKLTNAWLKKSFQSLGNDPPIMFIIEGNLSSDAALQLEKKFISNHGRQIFGGALSSIMPGGCHSHEEMCRIGGRVGGKNTKALEVGIFASDYDRGAQTKLNWENGLMDHLDFRTIGSLGGNLVVEDKIGIHDPKYVELRSQWASGAAKASLVKGLFGICSEEWRTVNADRIFDIASKGGKLGGSVVGSMLWWNNGVINKKSLVCPGDDFVRGQLMSEKKRNSVSKNFKHKENV